MSFACFIRFIGRRSCLKLMNRQILVVDDQPGIRMLLSDVFKSKGYQVQTANTGAEALEILSRSSFDLLVIDYQLPIVDGAGVLNELKKRNMQIPTIMISGLIEELSQETVCMEYVKEIFSKPFNIRDVCSAVQSILS